jgi:hypothetical protein
VGKANAARECAPDGVPTIQQRRSIQKMVGTATSGAFAHPAVLVARRKIPLCGTAARFAVASSDERIFVHQH